MAGKACWEEKEAAAHTKCLVRKQSEQEMGLVYKTSRHTLGDLISSSKDVPSKASTVFLNIATSWRLSAQTHKPMGTFEILTSNINPRCRREMECKV